MCNTVNGKDAQVCKSCGYIFEDFSTTEVDKPSPPVWEEQRQPQQEQTPAPSFGNFGAADISPYQPSTNLSDSPIFVVTKSITGSLLIGVLYLVFVSFFAMSGGFDPTGLVVIAVFVLLAVLPVLFAPRKYEFSDDSLRMVKILGGNSEIPYSELEIHEGFTGRRPQIILTSLGQRNRTIVVPGNPTNAALGMDLRQFLSKRVRKFDNPKANQQETTSDDTASPESAIDDDDFTNQT